MTLIGALLLGASLSSCALGPVRLEVEAPSLPALTPVDRIRETAARSEAAAAERALALAADASACPQCAEVLRAVAAASAEREQVLGGVWDPWDGEVPAGAQDVPAIAAAPVEVSDFAAWLARTARRDLAAAADPERTAASDALVLASTALGRERSALALARVYGIDLDAQPQALEDLDARLVRIAGSDSLALLGTWGLDPGSANSPVLEEVDLASAEHLADSAELTRAIASWDCTAQSLPRAQLVEGSISGAEALQDVLFSRIDALISAGAADERTARCEVSDLSSEGLATGLVAADLALLSSDDATVRLIGAQAALKDLEELPIGSDASAPALIGATRRS